MQRENAHSSAPSSPKRIRASGNHRSKGRSAAWPSDASARIKELRLIDDRFMQAALKGHAECLELVARIALDDPSLCLTEVRDQETLPSIGGKSPTLDFLCEATDGRRVDVEIESTPDEFPPRRARFYSAMLDARSLPRGANYNDLPDAVVIVLCGGDPIGQNMQRYTFRRVADEGAVQLGDGSTIIYVNCTVQNDTPLGKLAHDLMCADPGEMHYAELAECVRAAKEGGATVNVLDEVYELGVDEGREAGRAEGKAEGRESAFLDMVRKGLVSAGDAARELGLDERQVIERAKSPTSTAPVST